MNISKRFFILNIVTVFTTIVITALTMAVFTAIYFNIFNKSQMDYKQSILLLLDPSNGNKSFLITVSTIGTIIFAIVFISMNLWIIKTFRKDLILPATKLNIAVLKLLEGDLSLEIPEEGRYEISELSNNLEKLRIRLKEAVYLQEKYDENRKFLISSISHDLKTPVTSIKGYIEGILDGVATSPEKISEYLNIAKTKTELMDSMINELLLFSHLDLNQVPFAFEKTDILSYFQYCVDDNLNQFQKNGVGLELHSNLIETVIVEIDRERFGRAVQNILNNALKYSNKNVDIFIRETLSSVIIEIKDYGIGIAEKDLPYIFERFYRADSSRKNVEGSGLGLAIAKQIIECHDGKVWALSRRGEGTSIIISLKKWGVEVYK